MTLQDRLMAEMRDAMRSKDVVRRDTIRMVRAAVTNAEIDLKRAATDKEVQALIAREAKRRHEAVDLFRQGGRQDLVDEELAGLAVLEEYLPEQISEAETEQVLRQIIADLGATSMAQMGPVMRQAMSQLRGQADGGLVNKMVRQLLSE